MAVQISDIIQGRKTFFITPDLSLFPESFLEDYFALGFECYFVGYDKRIPLEKKLDIIINLFPDIILFFNLDYNLHDTDWKKLITKIIKKYDNRTDIGVMYVKHQAKEYRAELERTYIYDMGLSCGCIQLEYQKKNNFEIIEKILFANQAKGKRMQLRAFCTSACTFSCMFEDKPYSGVLEDISLNHFSFVLPKDANFVIDITNKVKDFHISIRGVMLRSDAMLITKREIGDNILYVFVYVSPNGQSGLEERTKHLIIPTIYRLMADNCANLLYRVYTSADDGDYSLENVLKKDREARIAQANANAKKKQKQIK